MESVVAVECLSEIDTQAIDVELLDESGGTADKKMPHDLLPISGRKTG
jgi:hypothetical protein